MSGATLTSDQRLALVRMALAEAGLDPEAAYRDREGTYRMDNNRVPRRDAWKALSITRTATRSYCWRCFDAAHEAGMAADPGNPFYFTDKSVFGACQSQDWLNEDCGVLS